MIVEHITIFQVSEQNLICVLPWTERSTNSTSVSLELQFIVPILQIMVCFTAFIYTLFAVYHKLYSSMEKPKKWIVREVAPISMLHSFICSALVCHEPMLPDAVLQHSLEQTVHSSQPSWGAIYKSNNT